MYVVFLLLPQAACSTSQWAQPQMLIAACMYREILFVSVHVRL